MARRKTQGMPTKFGGNLLENIHLDERWGWEDSIKMDL
jgi:hypothetical protein